MIKLILSLIIFLFILTLGTTQHFLIKAIILSVVSTLISIILLPKSTEKSKFNFRVISYIAWLCKEIFLSSLSMIKIILQPRSLKLDPVISTIKTQQQDDQHKAMLANSITLTPGTITINVSETIVDVHAISKEHFKDLKNSSMDKLIKQTNVKSN